MHHRGRRGEKGVGRDEHVLSFNAERPKNDFQRTGPAVDGDGVAHPAESGEFLFELRPVFAERQLAAGQHFLNPIGNPYSVFRQKLYFCCRNRGHRLILSIHRLVRPKI